MIGGRWVPYGLPALPDVITPTIERGKSVLTTGNDEPGLERVVEVMAM